MNWIDLRSDTVTRPSRQMLQAMVQAEVGDDVFGDDPTVTQLEKTLAERASMEAGVFVPSGTQSNLLAVMSHCERGDEYIAGQTAHIYRWEAGGAAVLGSVQPQPVELEKDGTFDLTLLKKYIKPDDSHHARTKLLCLENTLSGKVLPGSYLEKASRFAKDNRLQIHLDGARVYNAAVKMGVELKEITRHFDSVSICLSKGLGAPVGSVLCGSKELIQKARRWRKMVGGGMRQAGVLAAAGLYALDHNVERLAEDHENAQYLAQHLLQIEELEVDMSWVQTNMIFLNLGKLDPERISHGLGLRGIKAIPSQTMRLVTHLDVNRNDMKRVVEAFKEVILMYSSR